MAAYQSAPERDFRVTTDGRTQWFPQELYDASFAIYGVENGWEAELRKLSPDAAGVPRHSFIEQELVNRPAEWNLVHEDNSFSAFVAVH